MKSFLTASTPERFAHRFRDDASGSIAIVFALVAVVLMLAIGAAVDVGRWLHARDQTAAAIDAAVLAGGRALQVQASDDSAAVAAAQKYYAQNVTSRMTVTDDTVNFAVNGDGMGVTATGSAFIETPFLRFAGIEKLPLVSASQTNGVGGSEIGMQSTNTEISLMLDITGSMAGQKLQDLKDAATDLVKVVILDSQSKYSTKMAIVPFSDSVRLPTTAISKAMGTPVKIVKKTSGSKQYIYNRTETCVVERAGTNRYTDVAPGSGNYSMPLRLLVATIDTSDGTVVIDNNSSKVQGTTATVTWKNRPNNYQAIEKAVTGFATCTLPLSAEVLPLTSTKQTLTDKIAALQVAGSTAGQVGTAWAWYTLSTNWSSLWPTDSQPKAKSADLTKIAILMTDGEYNTEYTTEGIKTGSSGAGTTPANADSTTQARELCKGMKAAGVVVYTIGFDVGGATSTAAQTLSQCATDPAKFYNADDGEELKQAYRDIAVKLTSLYLSK
jgi:Flp pilus assembly protein TadG